MGIKGYCLTYEIKVSNGEDDYPQRDGNQKEICLFLQRLNLFHN